MEIRLAVALAFVCAGAVALDAQSVGKNFYHGLYVNEDHGFSVTIPPGLVGEGSATGAPNHGFEIRSSRNAVIWVDASYGLSDIPFRLLRVNAHLENVKSIPAATAGTQISKRDSTRIGDGSGVRPGNSHHLYR